MANPLRPAALSSHARSFFEDRLNVALCILFLLMATFYLWTAHTSFPLTIHGGQTDPYNRLASALLHLHLSVRDAPAKLLGLSEPYDPNQNASFRLTNHIHDYSLYHGRLYLTWGAAPAIVLLVPLHLLGLEPSSSLTTALFAIAGLGFALAILSVILRQLGNRTLWMWLLAALTLALCSAVPYSLRRPEIYEEAIAGGYCFAMAGVWLATSALLKRRASLLHMVLMSLCFGLATGSRPTLGLTALLLIPVYRSLRHSEPRRGMLAALTVPVGACFTLILAYNYARFGSPSEFGTKYQMAGFNSQKAHFADLSYVLPGSWFYAIAPPRLMMLFPFVLLGPPPTSFPLSLPRHYVGPFPTGGLLSTTPIVGFLTVLPWIWRRRPALLGTLAAPLLMLSAIGTASLLFLSYEFFSAIERYEVDFATLFILGGLASWLALASDSHMRYRRALRLGGAVLALWGCFTGLTISFTGIADLLNLEHQETWRTLERLSSPLPTAIAALSGGPVLAEVFVSNPTQSTPVGFLSIKSNVSGFQLASREQAGFTIVSPDGRNAALLAHMAPRSKDGSAVTLEAIFSEAGKSGNGYTVRPHGSAFRIPLHLHRGLNHFLLNRLVISGRPPNKRGRRPDYLLMVSKVSLTTG